MNARIRLFNLLTCDESIAATWCDTSSAWSTCDRRSVSVWTTILSMACRVACLTPHGRVTLWSDSFWGGWFLPSFSVPAQVVTLFGVQVQSGTVQKRQQKRNGPIWHANVPAPFDKHFSFTLINTRTCPGPALDEYTSNNTGNRISVSWAVRRDRWSSSSAGSLSLRPFSWEVSRRWTGLGNELIISK